MKLFFNPEPQSGDISMETDNVGETRKDALAEAMEAVTGDHDDSIKPSESSGNEVSRYFA
jgi:hypothetical protein